MIGLENLIQGDQRHKLVDLWLTEVIALRRVWVKRESTVLSIKGVNLRLVSQILLKQAILFKTKEA
jgi:hypothetical protein